ncbi:urease accessory protein UreE [Catellatospora methionotrophica]|uniref:urease accessory protein UreE n=1 Tax=Catellatospora methionotrophica TaxID=121620 RepID=UPI0033E35BC4
MTTSDVRTALIEQVLGNAADPHWRERLAGATVDTLALDQWEAQKNRLRKATVGGVEVAVSLDRAARLRDGDVLRWDPDRNAAVVARIELGEVMVIDLAPLHGLAPQELARTAVELGHALGNQHWPAVIKGSRVFVPLTVDRKVTSAVMKTHNLPRVVCEFVPGSEVTPFLAPHEARRLFGGAAEASHTHDDPR